MRALRFSMLTLALAALAMTLAAATVASAADAPAPAQGKAKLNYGPGVTLFDGKSLDGWKVIGCEAEVKDGAIFLKAGNGVVRTEKQYTDFVIEYEWKALKADDWDSGLYFRCDDPPPGAPWPKMYQANLRKGMEGNVEELPAARSKGLVKDGQWNTIRLSVIGERARLRINGQRAWTADGVKTPTGYIALQAEIPGGGQFLFRNIRIMELNTEK
jgi:hypothetical protein